MTHTTRTLAAWVFVAAGAFTSQAIAGVFDPVVYELLPGSTILDDCFCDRLPIERPLTGTLVLTRLPVRIEGELYSVTEIDLVAPSTDPAVDFEYRVKGPGTLHRTGENLRQQSMDLDLVVNDAPDIRLASGTVDAGSAWPGLDITVKEDGTRDPFHIFTIRIAASPRVEGVPYELVEGDTTSWKGSFFIDDCRICGRPTIPLPVVGTFILRQVSGNDVNPASTYLVEALDLHTTLEGFDYRIAGSGKYEQGGEVALLQAMDLTVSVNDEQGVILSSGRVPFPDGVSFPEIGIGLEHQNPPSELHVYSLELVARPAMPQPAPEFRRGDANADGSGDIADAVYILLWRFAGSTAPPCLEAADTNGDGGHDISDAVYFLLYLFRGGPAPPAPDVEICGPAKQLLFGCDSYPPCGV